MKSEIKTPSWVDSLVDHLAPPHHAEEIRGDMYELFTKDVREKGLRSANRRYALNALGFLSKRFFWRKQTANTNLFTMLGSYFKMAKRSLSAHKGTTVINMLGLVIGIASALIIINVIRFELSFDKSHTHADRIYRLVRVGGTDMSEYSPGISFPVPRAIREEISSVEQVVSVEYFGGAYVDIPDEKGSSVKKFREEAGFALVEPSFFKVFDFKGVGLKWIAGDPDKSLIAPFDIVLTQTMARKYFGDDDPIGRAMRLQQKYDCKVTGVIEDLPPNTDFPFTVLISYASVPTLSTVYDDWFAVNSSHHVYLLPVAGTTQAELEEQITQVHEAHTPKDIHESRKYIVQKLADVHHDSKVWNFNRRSVSRETLLGFGVVGFFLLLTATINYINLSTAQSVLRAKEIGLRKAMGASRRTVLFQFLIETFVIVFLAGLLAMFVGEVLLINLQSLLNIRLTENLFMDPFILVCLLVIILSVTIFAGFYPSLVLSRLNPTEALKSRFSTERSGGIRIRKVLVVVQFTITQILAVGAYIVMSQMQYFSHVNMGFNREGIVNARIPNRDPAVLSVLENKLRAQAFVEEVSLSNTLPSGVKRSRYYADIGRPEANALKDYVMYESVSIDPGYLALYDINLLAGRNLTTQDSVSNILVNRTLVKNLQLGTPREAVGRQLKITDGRMLTIVGVIEDYFGNSMKEPADNLVMLVDPANYSAMSVKLSIKGESGSLPEVVREIGEIWTEAFPEYLFTYQFFDENISAFYEQEEKYAQLFKILALTFLLIGCLGLFGLISFVVNRKGKEVAIRKVLGATINNILVMFSREYVMLIIVSFLVAVPVAYYVVNDWLSNFANHIPLEWWLFVMPGAIVLLIALLVICAKSLKVARTNPVENLKYE